MDCHDTTTAGPAGEGCELGEACALVLEADETQTGIAAPAGLDVVGRAADRHPEALFLVSTCSSSLTAQNPHD